MVERVGLAELVGLVGRVELVALRLATPHTHTAPPAEVLKLVEGVVQLGKQRAAGGGRLERVGLVRDRVRARVGARVRVRAGARVSCLPPYLQLALERLAE